MKTISLGTPFINLKGEWKENEEYEYLDAVTHKGSLFIANKKFILAGTTPGKNSAWLLSARGENEEVTKELIKNILAKHETLSPADGVHSFPEYKEGQLLTVKDDKLVFTDVYHMPITQDKTWYVRADGDDENDGSADTPEKAFKTIQKCLDYIYSHFVQADGNVKIYIGEGTFAGFELNGTNRSIYHIFMYGAGTDKTVITHDTRSSKRCVYVGSYKRIVLQDINFLFDDSSVKLTSTSSVIQSDLYSVVRLYSCLITIKETKGTQTIYACNSTNYSSIELGSTSGKSNEIVTESTVATSKIIVTTASRCASLYVFDTLTANGNMGTFLTLEDKSYFYLGTNTKLVGSMVGIKFTCSASSTVITSGKGNILFGNVNGSLSTGATYN